MNEEALRTVEQTFWIATFTDLPCSVDMPFLEFYDEPGNSRITLGFGPHLQRFLEMGNSRGESPVLFCKWLRETGTLLSF